MREIDWTLLDRYLGGECAADECVLVEAWLAEAPEHQTLLDMLQETTGAPPADLVAAANDRGEVWALLARQLAADGVVLTAVEPREKSLAGKPRTFAIPPRRRALAYAALVGTVLLSGTLATGALLRRDTSPALAPVAALRTLRTPNGQRAAFRLPDGTRVMLGVASTLRYASDYGTLQRRVYLEGEAYFKVTHDDHRPFVVHAGDLVAEDLGTQFTVRAYPEDAHASVVVREGEVGVRAATSADATVRVLVPGQLGRLGTAGDPIVQAVDVDAYFAWTDGVLVLRDTPLRDALPQLSRWFDVELRLGDSALGSLPLTATLRTSSVPDLLDNLSAALPVRPMSQARVVTLYSATVHKNTP